MKSQRAYIIALKRYLLQKSKPYPLCRPSRPRQPRKPFQWRPRKMAIDRFPLDWDPMEVDKSLELGEHQCSAMDIDKPIELEVPQCLAMDYEYCGDVAFGPLSQVSLLHVPSPAPLRSCLSSASVFRCLPVGSVSGRLSSRSIRGHRFSPVSSRRRSTAATASGSLPDRFSRVNSTATCPPTKPLPTNRKITAPSGRYSSRNMPADVSQHLAGPTVASTAAGEVMPVVESSSVASASPVVVRSPVVVPPPVAESVAVHLPVAASVAVPSPVAASVVVSSPVAASVAVPLPVAASVVVPSPVTASVAVPSPVAASVVVPSLVTAPVVASTSEVTTSSLDPPSLVSCPRTPSEPPRRRIAVSRHRFSRRFTPISQSLRRSRREQRTSTPSPRSSSSSRSCSRSRSRSPVAGGRPRSRPLPRSRSPVAGGRPSSRPLSRSRSPVAGGRRVRRRLCPRRANNPAVASAVPCPTPSPLLARTSRPRNAIPRNRFARREQRRQRTRTPSPRSSSSSASASRSCSPRPAAGGRRIRHRLPQRRANNSAATSALPCSSSPSPCPSSTPSPCISSPAAGSALPCPSRSAVAFSASSAPSCPFALATANDGAAGQYRRPASPLSRDSSPLMPSRCGTVSPLVLELAHSPVNGPTGEHVDSVEDAIDMFQRLETIQALDEGSSQPGSPRAEREESLQPPPVNLNEADLISNEIPGGGSEAVAGNIYDITG
ncbi:hypothetical protein K450DRAFT_275820 [Umbelopsis ramanniana AG]|uniref:Uncharacterized protein n=1 Tax=Umbelopsis ramanniana AG TaxID=1314678 RepID=A0AAD5E1T3_UMBRA|nr:uncharacterized protein K450DRAFT_275820 [Umbelopsis ramanniana AG]KAI8575214.1 hypothetical protein K450DRAFT_275820 [Umbelopsis ramanniana AG]